MDFFTLLAFAAFAAYQLKTRAQKQRVALLGSLLSQYQIEKLMESITQGYARALGEAEPIRQAQVWNLLTTSESALSEQLNRFVLECDKVQAPQARVSRFALAFPFADTLFPAATFDLRRAMRIHAQGVARAVENSLQLSPKKKAFMLSAELYLLQHTCHWFCRSKTVASARLLTRHHTAYMQVLAAVAPETRRAYSALVEA